MKELTIEEKAKAYDEALKRAREWHNDSHITIGLKGNLEDIFPELKESEDEKIRKNIIATIHLYYGKPLEDEAKEMIAWLEKQEGCEYIKKDWLEHIKQSWYKEGFIDGKYSGGTSKEWTINDAATLKELIDFLENGTAKLQHDLTKYANWLKIQFTPIEKQGEQKPAWSEEDEEILRTIISDGLRGAEFDMLQINWLKSLKQRIGWKPSDEQIECLYDAVKHYQTNGYPASKLNELYEQMSKIYKL